MMQTADVRKGDYLSQTRQIDRPRLWTLFVQREMRSRLVIVRKVGTKYSFQVQFIEDDGMIEALAPY